MVTTSTTYRKLSYKELQNLAYDFLNKYTDGQLPVNLIYIINQIDNLYLMKYSAFARQHGLELEEVTNLLQSDDGALWYQEPTDTYILLYNDTVTSKERIRFTIAHELGHYVLRHNEITDKTIISRYNLTNSEYNEFEREANFFGKHLLVPFPILGNYVMFFHSMNDQFIQNVFQVSFSVANYVIKNLKSMQTFGLVKEGHEVEKKFSRYITISKSTRICRTCCSKIDRNSRYCHICSTQQPKGTTTLEAYLENREKEKERMRYRKYDLDLDGYPTICPNCENEELDSKNYCNVCGIYTRNICLGNYKSNYDTRGYALPIEDFLEGGCKTILSGNSRYCSDCGGKSSYYFQGLLKNWNLEKDIAEELPF